MKIPGFLYLLLLTVPLCAQTTAAPVVEKLIRDYCGESPQPTLQLTRGPSSYGRCREMATAKALDAHFVALNEENERLRTALNSVCALAPVLFNGPPAAAHPATHKKFWEACPFASERIALC